jgi:hypothetical protein
MMMADPANIFGSDRYFAAGFPIANAAAAFFVPPFEKSINVSRSTLNHFLRLWEGY